MRAAYSTPLHHGHYCLGEMLNRLLLFFLSLHFNVLMQLKAMKHSITIYVHRVVSGGICSVESSLRKFTL